jgi:hypothetical protein
MLGLGLISKRQSVTTGKGIVQQQLRMVYIDYEPVLKI